ncbi:DUF3347 domain-containing protein [Mucilaginibacter sp. CSA2-8R]|uniref:DUF3347 domain-containing protein n=1 Tax=Mucilaginibacter sp. CSA2-8R TaxID=3141542 RepID=UPI00315D9DF4
MKRYFLLALIAGSGLTACKSGGKQEASAAQSGDSTATVTTVAQTDTAKVYNAYLSVKDNLVKTDSKGAQQSAKALAANLSNIKGCTEAADLATRIAATDDVKSQRNIFLLLSQDVIPLVKGMKTKSGPVYVAYCPMAGNGKGGYWLSAQKEIKNPYYGDEMLECGEVKEEIK